MRTTISLDDAIAELAAAVATKENRSFSNLIEVALSEYCEAAKEIDAVTAEATSAAEVVGPARVLSALKGLKAGGYEAAAAAVGGGK